MMRKVILVVALTCLLALPVAAAPANPAELVEGYFATVVEFISDLLAGQDQQPEPIPGQTSPEWGLTLEPDGQP